jgi:Kef-type K+ transport system membrane component KefB
MSDELTIALQSLFVVALVAALAPLVVGLIPLRVPQVVILIIGGVIVGPEALDLAEPASIELLSNVGLGFLFLLAGYELELELFRQRAGKLGVVAWVASAVLAGAVVGLLAAMGLVRAFVPVALALTTTALGTLLPILRDNNMLRGSFGSYLLAGGAVGEFFSHRCDRDLPRVKRQNHRTGLVAGSGRHRFSAGPPGTSIPWRKSSMPSATAFSSQYSSSPLE